MIIKIDHNSEAPIYRQIYNAIISAVATGELPPGSTLPSIRQLASDLEVNMLTVSKVYNILKQEEYISLNRRRGAVICETSYISKQLLAQLIEQLKPIINSACAKGMKKEDFITLCAQSIEEVYSNRTDKLI